MREWFTFMMQQHYGSNYGSEFRNRYMFYRRMYEMPAMQAWKHAHK